MTTSDPFAHIDRMYRVIYADPPWQYEQKKQGDCTRHYGTMSIEELCKLPVKSIAMRNSLLFMWTTWPILAQGTPLQVMKQWGFEPKGAAFVWIKTTAQGTPHLGLGRWTRGNSEPCMIGVRGENSFEIIDNSQPCLLGVSGKGPGRDARNVSQVVMSHRREHSRKPDRIRSEIERLCTRGPRIELFARTQTKGWDAWGNETTKYGGAG